jgi:hypothetical protein
MPFPLPLVGFKLPAHAQMPPIEKRVYEKWAAANAPASSPPYLRRRQKEPLGRSVNEKGAATAR